MLKDKLKFHFLKAMESKHVQFVQQDVRETVESDYQAEQFADCACKQIHVYIDVTSTNHYYSTSFKCQCPCKRAPLEDRKLFRADD